MTRYFYLLAIAAVSFFAACKKQPSVDRPPVEHQDDDPSAPIGVPTAVGTPTGPAVTKRIGPAGGSMAFTTGRISNQSKTFDLTFPQGCFETEVEITVQPIENMCHNGIGSAFRITANTTVEMKKPAELQITEDDIPWPNKPEILISVQDPVIRVWRGARGRKDVTTGKQKFKIHRLADWALFENYHLRVFEKEKFTAIKDSVNGDHIGLISSQPVKMEVYRLFVENLALPSDDNEKSFIPLPSPVNIKDDRIDALKWRLNGASISETDQVIPQNAVHGFYVFEGMKFETLRFFAPLVLPTPDQPLDVRIEAEVRGKNNGPMAIMIQRFRITNPNEYKLNGATIKNAYGQGQGGTGFFTVGLRRSTNPMDEHNLFFATALEVKPHSYELTSQFDGLNVLGGVSLGPKTRWDHSYVDEFGTEHFSNGDVTISGVKEFNNYRIVAGTINSGLFNYDRTTRQLSTTSATGKFSVVVHK